MQETMYCLQLERLPGFRGDSHHGKQALRRRDTKEAVVRAFRMLWKAGLLHGDIAARNILVADGSASIVDLGRASVRSQTDDSDLRDEIVKVHKMCGLCLDETVVAAIVAAVQ